MQKSSREELSIATLAQGALLEQFNKEFSRVLVNIADPNTDPKKARKIVITVDIKPNEQRNLAVCSVQTKATLMPPKGIATNIIIDRDNQGNVVAAELMSESPGQLRIDEDGSVQEAAGKASLTVVAK